MLALFSCCIPGARRKKQDGGDEDADERDPLLDPSSSAAAAQDRHASSSSANRHPHQRSTSSTGGGGGGDATSVLSYDHQSGGGLSAAHPYPNAQGGASGAEEAAKRERERELERERVRNIAGAVGGRMMHIQSMMVAPPPSVPQSPIVEPRASSPAAGPGDVPDRGDFLTTTPSKGEGRSRRAPSPLQQEAAGDDGDEAADVGPIVATREADGEQAHGRVAQMSEAAATAADSPVRQITLGLGGMWGELSHGSTSSAAGGNTSHSGRSSPLAAKARSNASLRASALGMAGVEPGEGSSSSAAQVVTPAEAPSLNPVDVRARAEAAEAAALDEQQARERDGVAGVDERTAEAEQQSLSTSGANGGAGGNGGGSGGGRGGKKGGRGRGRGRGRGKGKR